MRHVRRSAFLASVYELWSLALGSNLHPAASELPADNHCSDEKEDWRKSAIRVLPQTRIIPLGDFVGDPSSTALSDFVFAAASYEQRINKGLRMLAVVVRDQLTDTPVCGAELARQLAPDSVSSTEDIALLRQRSMFQLRISVAAVCSTWCGKDDESVHYGIRTSFEKCGAGVVEQSRKPLKLSITF